MNNTTSKILLIFQLLCLLCFTAGIVTSVQPTETRDACPDPILVNSTESKNMVIDDGGNLTLIDEETQKEADSLAGTCPKGFCCSCASCPLFSDIDDDIFCDRGEEPDN